MLPRLEFVYAPILLKFILWRPFIISDTIYISLSMQVACPLLVYTPLSTMCVRNHGNIFFVKVTVQCLLINNS